MDNIVRVLYYPCSTQNKNCKNFGLEVHVTPQNFAPSKNFPLFSENDSLIIDNIPSWFDVHVFPPIEDRKLEVNEINVELVLWVVLKLRIAFES